MLSLVKNGFTIMKKFRAIFEADTRIIFHANNII